MQLKTTPEILLLEQFLEELQRVATNNEPMLSTVRKVWLSVSEKPGDPIRDILNIINVMPAMAASMPSLGSRRTAEKCVEALDSIFSTNALKLNWAAWQQSHSNSLSNALTAIGNFYDCKFNTVAFLDEKEKIEADLVDLEATFASSSMSYASISILVAQLHLMRKSLDRFDATGVGPFRESWMSAVGRVVIEIHADTQIAENDRAALVKRFIEVVGIVSTTKDIVTLAGPAIQLALVGPS